MKCTQHELIRGLHNLDSRHNGSVVTIGSFDGVHLGHQAILKQVVDEAKKRQLPSVVIIFEPQPHEYFAGNKAPARLMRFREKVEALFEQGIDSVLCLQFNQALRSLSARAFIERILVQGLGTQFLVVGDDFRFGCDRSGDYSLLKAAGQEHLFEVTDTATLDVFGERVSSTRIRDVIHRADFALAEELLGKPYSITGRVVYGRQLGRKLNAPTANVLLHRYRSPLTGVFAVRVNCSQGQYLGVANVGVKPTVEGQEKPILEVHLFDYSGNLYGQRIQVAFLEKLREEKKFSSIDELQAQIAVDISTAKALFTD